MKILRVTVAILAALLIVVTAAGLVGLRMLRPGIERAASEASGLEVKIGRAPGFGLFPDLRVTVHDLEITNGGKLILSAKEANVRTELGAVLRKEIRVHEIKLAGADVTIEKNADGKYNFEAAGKKPARQSAPLELQHLSFAGGKISYADRQSGGGFQAENCDGELRQIRLAAGSDAKPERGLFSTANLACEKFQQQGYPPASEVKLSVNVEGSVYHLDPLSMRVLDSPGTGKLRIDRTADAPKYHLQFNLKQLRSEDLLKSLSAERVATGPVDVSADLTFQGKNADTIKRNLAGSAILRGRGLTLHGTDLDQSLARYESSQNFSLVDAGALFLAGPLGLAVTKGYEFSGISRVGGSTRIQQLVADWRLSGGVARAHDVAMATQENRLALTGGIDLANERFENLTIALVDERGCPKLRQRVSGSIKQPVVEKVDKVSSLAGPVIGLFKKAAEALPGGKCEVFYTGAVAAPNSAKPH